MPDKLTDAKRAKLRKLLVTSFNRRLVAFYDVCTENPRDSDEVLKQMKELGAIGVVIDAMDIVSRVESRLGDSPKVYNKTGEEIA